MWKALDRIVSAIIRRLFKPKYHVERVERYQLPGRLRIVKWCAAPADAPIGPNMEPAFAPFIAELTVSIATLKPSAIPPNTPPNESPSFENVSERNCPVCIISLMPSSISHLTLNT